MCFLNGTLLSKSWQLSSHDGAFRDLDGSGLCRGAGHAILHGDLLGYCPDGTWRANIGFFDWDVPGEPSWTEWFAEYQKFILHAARIAEAEGCAMLCIGCEMVRADGQDAHWRSLIAAVRAVYTGVITYNGGTYQEDRVTWWGAVDVITSSGYYLIDSWESQLDRIEPVVREHGKPSSLWRQAAYPATARQRSPTTGT